MTRWLRGGTIITADPAQPRAESLVVRGERIVHVGTDATAARWAGPDAEVVDLDGRTVLPGFVDGHAHVLKAGEAQLRAELTDAADLATIQRRLAEWAQKYPDAPRVFGRGWLYSAVPDGRPTREMLDAVVADRPVYLDANDYHSVWVNTAALAELGITRDTPDPVGGRIVRDPDSGEATGHLEETAAMRLAWAFLDDAATDADRDRAVAAAAEAYLSSGVTCVVDMALDERGRDALLRVRPDLRVVGHWFVHRDGDPEEQIRRAAELAAPTAQTGDAQDEAGRNGAEWMRVTGVKFIVDGVIDGCTATMLEPYADGSNAEPIWDLDALAPAVAAADAAGLQIALHAIGDRATRTALDALEYAQRANGPRPRRHRIEHLEYVDPADVPRLAALGVTASMQPVHADPAIRPNWTAMLGDHRADRGFAWPEMTAAGATLAFGTDAPTAPHPPLPNLHIATTRRSAMDPSLPPLQPHYALPAAEALAHATADSAWACRAEDSLGRLAAGLLADYVVLDADPFRPEPDALLRTRVLRTVVGGRVVW